MKTNKFIPALIIPLVFCLGCKKAVDSSALISKYTSVSTLNAVNKAVFMTPDSSADGAGSNWGKINFDLIHNDTKADSVVLSFDGTLCREIQAGEGYTLAYVDVAGNSLNTIALKDLLVAPLHAVDTTKKNISENWYTYTDGKQYGLMPVNDRYTILFKGKSLYKATVLYVLQLETVDCIPSHTSGFYFGRVSFIYKRLI